MNTERNYMEEKNAGKGMEERNAGNEMEEKIAEKVMKEKNTGIGMEEKNAGNDMEELQKTVARLRAPDGCPWDREQTHASLKAACIEEAAEVVCGINILEKTGKAESLREELGDLLLQVVMHAQIAKEEGLFTRSDVIRTINQQMIWRHPHVFGKRSGADGTAGAAASAVDIHADWKKIKEQEKQGREWEEAWLFEAFDEAEELIGTARERKKSKS